MTAISLEADAGIVIARRNVKQKRAASILRIGVNYLRRVRTTNQLQTGSSVPRAYPVNVDVCRAASDMVEEDSGASGGIGSRERPADVDAGRKRRDTHDL